MKNISKHKKYAFLFALVLLLAFSTVKFAGLADTPTSAGESHEVSEGLSQGHSGGVTDVAPSPLTIYTGSFGTCAWSYDDVTKILTISPDPITGGNEFPTDSVEIQLKTGIYLMEKIVFDGGPMTTTRLDSLFANLPALTEVEGWENVDTSAATSTNKMFNNCSSLTEVNSDSLNINSKNVTDMSEMFRNCQALVSADLNFLDMRNVTTTEGMFQDCLNFETLLADQWNTSKITSMESMFDTVGKMQTFSMSWDMSNVTTIENMFNNCSMLTSFSADWDTSKITNMSGTFAVSGLTSMGTISQWDVSNVTTINRMFNTCTSLETVDLNSWGAHTSNITDMGGLFEGCTNVSSILINDWDTGNVTDMSVLFYQCMNLSEIELNHWDTRNVTTMVGMFLWSGIEHLDLSNFNTEQVTNFNSMFSFASQLKTLNISSFVIDPSAAHSSMFSNAPLYELTLGDQFDFDMAGLSDADSSGVYPNAFYTIEWYLVENPSLHYDSTADFAGGYDSSWAIINSQYNLNKVAGTYRRKGQPISLTLEGNGGTSGGSSTVTTNTFYNYPLSISTTFERTGYNFVQWNGVSGTENLTYSASQLSNGITSSTFSSVMVFTAQWEAIPYTVTFDLSGVAASPIAPLTLAYEDLISEPATPYGYGYIFNGWYPEGSETYWDFASETMPADNVVLRAKWISLLDAIQVKEENVVIYKDESTASDIEDSVGVTTFSYTNYLGQSFTLPIDLEWDPAWISEGGVNEMRLYLVEPSTGARVYGRDSSYLYVLNRPYAECIDEIWIFEGETINTDIYSAIGYGEVPNFDEKRIDREKIDLTFDSSAVNIWDAGTYWANFSGTFKDYMAQSSTFTLPVTVHVQKRAGLTKEEKQQVSSSDFWVNVTEIYHTMKAGQIVDVNPSNYMDGGALRTETVADGLGYDRQLNVQVGEYIYMSPDIVNVLQEEKTGQMNVYLNGRSWIFNSDTTDAVGNDYPKGYYDLRMDITKKEAITNLVGADTPQMQLGFFMNRTWFGTPTFVITPNESIKSAVAGGATPYLFHYNESTNELELVGSMTVQSNGSLSIPMNGVYKDYVILTSLPQNGNYRITEHTNALDSKTYEAVANNIIDSGHALPSGNGLNGISTTKYARITEDAILSEKSETTQNTGLVIGLSALGIALVGGGYVFWKKKKGLDD